MMSVSVFSTSKLDTNSTRSSLFSVFSYLMLLHFRIQYSYGRNLFVTVEMEYV